MIRKIITIDQEKCNGCGLCVRACHEDAIGIRDGKACLLREDYCDGLGDCLPSCPMDAISFEEREALAYNESAVLVAKSKLRNFPIQLKLVSPNAGFLQGAQLLIAADCTAYACADFHSKFMNDKVTIIACPKLDGVQYAEKLTQIFAENEIQSITVVRMQVPCCGGLPYAVQIALEQCGKEIPLQIITLSPNGSML